MNEADWDDYFERLAEATRDAVAKFVVEHYCDEVCSLCFDSEPKYGYVLLAINTTESSRRHARHWRKRNIDYRRKLYAENYDTWISASKHQMRATAAPFYCNNSGGFEYQEYADVRFPEWQAFYESSTYPEPKFEDESDDYLENRSAFLFWRVHDALTQDGTYAKLKLASPTLLEFAFHDEDHCILDALNLP